jgi:hypothetical protein
MHADLKSPHQPATPSALHEMPCCADFFAGGWARLDRSSAARGWDIDARARIARRAQIAKIRFRKIQRNAESIHPESKP